MPVASPGGKFFVFLFIFTGLAQVFMRLQEAHAGLAWNPGPDCEARLFTHFATLTTTAMGGKMYGEYKAKVELLNDLCLPTA